MFSVLLCLGEYRCAPAVGVLHGKPGVPGGSACRNWKLVIMQTICMNSKPGFIQYELRISVFH